MYKKIVKFTVIFFLIGCAVYAGACSYIESHKKEVIKEFEKAFAIHCNGSIEFSDITLKTWSNFPSVFFEIKDLEFTSFNIEKHKEQTIQTKEARIKLSIAKLIRKKIQVKSIFIKDAKVELITNVDSTVVAVNKKTDKQVKQNKDLPLEKSTRLVVENLQFGIINHQKNKKFQFQVNEIDTDLNISDHAISGELDLDVIVSDLAFNTKNGSFFNGAQVSGTLKPTINLKSKKIDIPEFDLQIDDQVFEVSSKMNLEGPGSFLFSLENDKTSYVNSIGLLPEKIQKKLKSYSIEKPLYTYTTIEGSFAPKSNPVVDVKFKTENNSATIKNKISLDEVALSGKFINRVYDDERAKTESIKNARLLIDSFQGQYKGVDFQLDQASLVSTPEVKTAVKGKLTSTGNTEKLNKVLGSDTFFFEDGIFEVNAELNGDASYLDDLINKSELSLKLQNSSLVNHKTGLHIPIKNLLLSVLEEKALLKELQIELPSKDQINLSGEIDNIASIVKPDATKQTSSNIKIQSDKLIWDDFLAIIQATKSKKKVKKQDKHTLQETLKDVYAKFNPNIQIDIDELAYKSIEMKNFQSGLHYENQENLYLDHTSFNFDSSNVALSGHLNLAESKKINIDAAVEAKGVADDLNVIFNTKDFLFQKGEFDLNAKVSGDLQHIDKLLARANSTLKLEKANVYFKPKQLTIPIAILDVAIENNEAKLNQLQIDLDSGDQIDFSGKLENIEALLNEDSNDKVKTTLKIDSERLAWDDFATLFHKDKNAPKKQSKKTLKETLSHLYTTFDPNIDIDIAHFVYNEDINVQEFKTGVHFEDGENLKLNETSFVYDKKGIVNLSAGVNISDPEKTLVEVALEAKGSPEQLNTIFSNSNFLFKGGDFSLKTAVKGDIHQLNELVSNATTTLKLSDSKVYFKELEVAIPELEVDVQNNDAILKTLKVAFESGDQIDLSGEVDNLTTLLFHNENGLPVKSNLNIHSNKLVFEDFTKLFSKGNKDQKKEKSKSTLNTTIHHIHDQFDPTLTIGIDQFKYHNLEVENLKTNIHFEDANKIFLEDTGFNFYTGNVNLNAHLDISDIDKTLFALVFKTDKLDLEKVLNSFEYFGISDLKEAERIGGEISLDSFLEGEINAGEGLNTNSLYGEMSFDLEKIEVKRFKPIINITDKIFKKHRFDDIRFAPIKNTLYISENTVEIPQFEILSNAFDLFIEGHLGFQEKGTNIWASIPLGNLKNKDVVDIPDKEGYIATGKKVFIEIASEKNEKTKYQLHLTNKKLFQQKDILGQYKRKCKEQFQFRRKHKRSKKAEPQDIFSLIDAN